jgi:hypothetical protein
MTARKETAATMTANRAQPDSSAVLTLHEPDRKAIAAVLARLVPTEVAAEIAAISPLFLVYDSTSCIGRCGSACYDAAGRLCDCVCTGANHGVGRQQAIRNTWEHALAWLDRVAETHPSILAADILPGFLP